MNQKEYDKQVKIWGDCTNTYEEETKQYVYGKLMGLQQRGPKFILKDTKVLDIGGGPVSLLLKCEGLSRCRVVDTIDFPDWTKDRYKSKGIDVTVGSIEDNPFSNYDEAWLCNVLDCVEDMQQVVNIALQAAPTVRVFQWLTDDLTDDDINVLFTDTTTGNGNIVELKQRGCYGVAYYAVYGKE